MFEINVVKIGKIDVHFAYISVQLVPVQIVFSLYYIRTTLRASSCEENYIKNLVTSLLSKMSNLIICPKC